MRGKKALSENERDNSLTYVYICVQAQIILPLAPLAKFKFLLTEIPTPLERTEAHYLAFPHPEPSSDAHTSTSSPYASPKVQKSSEHS